MKIGTKSANDIRVSIAIQFGFKYHYYYSVIDIRGKNSLFLSIETTNTENNQTVNKKERLCFALLCLTAIFKLRLNIFYIPVISQYMSNSVTFFDIFQYIQQRIKKERNIGFFIEKKAFLF